MNLEWFEPLLPVFEDTYLCVGATPPAVSDQDEFGNLFREVIKKVSSLRYRLFSGKRLGLPRQRLYNAKKNSMPQSRIASIVVEKSSTYEMQSLAKMGA